MTAELKEKIAKAILERDVLGESKVGHYESEELASAALSAIEAAGYVVVPIEPTEEMMTAGWVANTYHNRFICCDSPNRLESAVISPHLPWQAMIEAAPKG